MLTSHVRNEGVLTGILQFAIRMCTLELFAVVDAILVSLQLGRATKGHAAFRTFPRLCFCALREHNTIFAFAFCRASIGVIHVVEIYVVLMGSMRSMSMEALLRDHDARWRVVSSFHARCGWVHHQLQGFNYFVESLLPEIVRENSDIVVEQDGRRHIIRFGDITIKKPTWCTDDGKPTPILPFECRVRRLTYQLQVTGTLLHEIWAVPTEGKTEDDDNGGGKAELLQRNEAIEVPFFRLPCMLRSKFCHLHDNDRHEDPLDPGGYFVINGVEKVLMSQLKLRGNLTFVFAAKGIIANKSTHVAEVRSMLAKIWRSTSTLKLLGVSDSISKTCKIVVLLPFVLRGATALEVPLICTIRAFEVIHDMAPATLDDIIGAFFLQGTTPDFHDDDTRNMARRALTVEPWATWSGAENLRWMETNGSKEKTQAKRSAYIRHILRSEFLPHVREVSQRLTYLGLMVRRLIGVQLGTLPVDDRDHNGNKRLDGPGPLLAILFRQLFRNHLKQIKQSVSRAVDANKHVNITDFMQPRRIELGIGYHFATGTWSLNRTSNNGVVQQMVRMSQAAMIAHLRRVSIPLAREGKAPLVRQLHPTDWRLFCPSETPEGAAVGLVKNLALLASITTGSETVWAESTVRLLLRDANTGPIPVMVNGSTVCTVADGDAVAKQLRDARRNGMLLADSSITWDTMVGVEVFMDGGRICSPVYVAESLHRLPEIVRTNAHHDLWPALVDQGVIEWLDKREESQCLVAANVDMYLSDPARYTHVEIDPSCIFGPTTACIPFSDHNQAPRNISQASMHKQAISMPMLNVHERFDVHLYAMNYPTRPIVSTRVGCDPIISFELPSGVSPIVAILCYGGMNQEDSLIISKGAIERGFARITSYSTFSADLRQGSTDIETFTVPNPNVQGRRGDSNYGLLGTDGIVPVNTRVCAGDVIIGRVLTRKASGSTTPEFVRDRSVALRKNEGGIVDAVCMVQNKDGMPSVRVRLRQTRIPEVGD